MNMSRFVHRSVQSKHHKEGFGAGTSLTNIRNGQKQAVKRQPQGGEFLTRLTRPKKKKGSFQVTCSGNLGSVGQIFLIFFTTPLRHPRIE